MGSLLSEGRYFREVATFGITSGHKKLTLISAGGGGRYFWRGALLSAGGATFVGSLLSELYSTSYAIKNGQKKTGLNTGSIIRPQYCSVNTSIAVQVIRLITM